MVPAVVVGSILSKWFPAEWMEVRMNRLGLGYQSSWFCRIVVALLAGMCLASPAWCGQGAEGHSVGYLLMNAEAPREIAKNGYLFGVDAEGNVTINKGDVALKVGYSLSDLTKEGGAGTQASGHGFLPGTGSVLVKLSLVF
jgi:hypothetical protein